MLTPAAVLLPAKIVGLWLLTSGHAMSGIGVILAAKVIGTAIVARMFRLCKEALLTLAWFSWGYRLVVRISTWVRTTDAWQTAMGWKNAIRANARELMRLLPWHNH